MPTLTRSALTLQAFARTATAALSAGCAGRLFFQQKTVSGRSTETLCSAECALVAWKRRERGW